jgi:hypothetical protein
MTATVDVAVCTTGRGLEISDHRTGARGGLLQIGKSVNPIPFSARIDFVTLCSGPGCALRPVLHPSLHTVFRLNL